MKQLKTAVSDSRYREQTDNERQLRFWKDDQEYLDKKKKEGKATVRFGCTKGLFSLLN
ncbi:hypothetical protein [Microcoleus sp. T3_D1]|uniref:hypothetical protein n=1 Tax=Microcoleus sp. T3_D1 TaxID=3055427 RepID=UPI002FD782FB